jgi:hypothetical protein
MMCKDWNELDDSQTSLVGGSLTRQVQWTGNLIEDSLRGSSRTVRGEKVRVYDLHVDRETVCLGLAID